MNGSPAHSPALSATSRSCVPAGVQRLTRGRLARFGWKACVTHAQDRAAVLVRRLHCTHGASVRRLRDCYLEGSPEWVRGTRSMSMAGESRTTSRAPTGLSQLLKFWTTVLATQMTGRATANRGRDDAEGFGPSQLLLKIGRKRDRGERRGHQPLPGRRRTAPSRVPFDAR